MSCRPVSEPSCEDDYYKKICFLELILLRSARLIHDVFPICSEIQIHPTVCGNSIPADHIEWRKKNSFQEVEGAMAVGRIWYHSRAPWNNLYPYRQNKPRNLEVTVKILDSFSNISCLYVDGFISVLLIVFLWCMCPFLDPVTCCFDS